MTRYLKLFAVQLRASTSIAMQYRVDFLVQGLMSVFGIAMALIPLRIVFSDARPTVAGWSFPEAMVVVGWFMLLKAVLEGAINPSLLAVVDHIRKGTLDFVLIKPADAQFLVSTSRFEPWRIADAVAGLAVFAWAFSVLGKLPGPAQVAAALAMLVIAVLVIYSIWILVISAAFFVVRIDNLTHLFTSIYDAARWPIDVFTGVFRIIFTFAIPLAIMTTYPAMALLGTLKLETALASLGSALVFAAVARAVWKQSLARYTSASS